MSKKFTPNVPDSSHPFHEITMVKGDQGDNARILFGNPMFIPVPCDDDGTNPVYINASTELMVIDGSDVLADGAVPGAWSLTQVSVENCTVNISGLDVSVITITSDEARIRVRANKTGEKPLYADIYVRKIYKGLQGDQGIQGVQGNIGASGIQGPAGIDGNGIIMKKHTIKFMASSQPANITNNSGAILTQANHGYSVGETVYLQDPYFSSYVISDVPNANQYRLTGLTYVSDLAVNVDNLSHLRNVEDQYNQPVYMPKGFIPARYMPIKMAIFSTLWNAGTFTGSILLYAGRAAYPYSGWYDYMPNKYFNSLNDQAIEDLSVKTDFLTVSFTDREFYINAVIYPQSTELWSKLTDVNFDIIIACYNFS